MIKLDIRAIFELNASKRTDKIELLGTCECDVESREIVHSSENRPARYEALCGRISIGAWPQPEVFVNALL